MTPIYTLFVSIFLAIAGQLVSKFGISHIGELTLNRSNVFATAIKVFANPFVILGLGIYGVSAFFWMVAISKLELSFAYPMLAITYVLVPILSCLIFKEHLTLMRILAMGVVIVGVILLGRS